MTPELEVEVPPNLHLRHNWGGGSSTWVDAFCAADHYAPSLVLEPRGTQRITALELVLTAGPDGSELGRWSLDAPISETAISHPEYAAILEEVVRTYEVGHIYVSSLIGHSLDALRAEVPVTVIHHDHHPFCAAIHLFFGEVCGSCEPERLERCLESNPLVIPGAGGVDYRMRLREAYVQLLQRADLVDVCPSESVARHLRRVDPRYRGVRFELIPHGVEEGADCFGGADPERRLRLLFLGLLSPWKGLDLVREELPRLQALADLHFLGPGHWAADLAGRTGVSIWDGYDSAELGTLLGEIQPDLAVFLSPVPESFSLTLSEARAHGIPAAARAVGAFVDRIDHGVDGFLLDPEDELAIEQLLELDGQRDRIREVNRALRSAPHWSRSDMVEAYYRLRGGAPAGLRRAASGA